MLDKPGDQSFPFHSALFSAAAFDRDDKSSGKTLSRLLSTQPHQHSAHCESACSKNTCEEVKPVRMGRASTKVCSERQPARHFTLELLK